MVIADILQNFSHSKTMFLHSGGEITYADLCSIKETNVEVLEMLRGRNIVIMAESKLHTAILCYLLDGVVNTLLFLPSDIRTPLHDKYLGLANIHFRVFLKDNKIFFEEYVDQPKVFDDFCETKWIIPTSGTTNDPKLIEHTLKNLIKTTKLDPKIGEKYRWGLVYDIYRFAGLQVYLQAFLGGGILIIPDENASISEMVSIFLKYRCNALSATPSYWRKLAMDPMFDKLSFDIISLGGEIVDQTILNFLNDKFPLAKITHIYASTEAGVGFHVSDKKSGFPLSYVMGEDHKIQINDGTLFFRSQTGEYISTGDLVEIRGDRVFFLGRDSGAINIGGNKVLPEEVESIILELDFVKEVKVYGIKNVFLGNLVTADIVVICHLDDDENASKLAVLSKCRDELAAFKVPVKINFVDNIEVTNSGKVKR